MPPERRAAILIAEDSQFDQMILRRAFSAAEIEADLTFVKDGEELLARLRTSADGGPGGDQPSIVLLDLHMPRMNGREALRAIRDDERLKHLPIVMLTTSDSEAQIREVYGLGANSYIVKPNNFDEVVATVRELQRYWFDTARLPGRPGA